MPILKCKMCGGDLHIEEGMTVCECEYCSTKQTVPVVDNEKKIKLFERANRLRMECQFDKAATVYESIIEEFDTEAEGYWGNLLCKYGIEYVDDPATGDKVPTCHRSSFDSVMDDKDFEMVMENCDAISRNVYREQAKQIEEIRKGIIEVSGKEEPYDIFICYKETAEDGQRTLDSVLAQDIYEALVDKGYRVFFSRITLEDKLGTEYEPYIFAALNSAKIMLAFGTTYDYYNAVWVKNEWSRYLKLMAKDKTKHLIPCYKDIDAYDIPKEFAKLQAQDLGKVGATQDLLRGIEKILGSKKQEVVKETVLVHGGNNATVDAMLKRGNIAIEDGDFDAATNYFDQALNINPECAEGYLGKFLASKKLTSLEKYLDALKDKNAEVSTETLYACEENKAHIKSMVDTNVLSGFLEEDDISKLYEFDRSYKSELARRKTQKEDVIAEVESEKLLGRARQYAAGGFKTTVENGIEDLYAVLDQRIADCISSDANSVARIGSSYNEHISNADSKARALRLEAEDSRDKYYSNCVSDFETANSIEQYEKVAKDFELIDGYLDSSDYKANALAKAKELTDKKNKALRKARIKTTAIVVSIITVAAIALLTVFVFIPMYKYNNAIKLMQAGNYAEAISAFDSLGDYQDSNSKVKECHYQNALVLMNAGRYSDAINEFSVVERYQDSADRIIECNYLNACALMDSGNYDSAIVAFENLGEYSDSASQVLECNYQIACGLMEIGNYDGAIDMFEEQSNYADSQLRIDECHYLKGLALMDEEDYLNALDEFDSSHNYSDASNKCNDCRYFYANQLIEEDRYCEAWNELNNVQDYQDVAELIELCKMQSLTNPVVGLPVWFDNASWIVLDIDGGQAFLLREEALEETKPYNNTYTNVTWATCSLRNWLNSSYYNSISSEYRNMIVQTQVANPNNTQHGTNGGPSTQDYVFLLSINEFNQYVQGTPYVFCHKENATGGAFWWWLRSPGWYSDSALCISVNGSLDVYGNHVDSDYGAVRPALWINLES